MRNRTVWIVTGLIFLLVLGGVFFFFDYMGVEPEETVEENSQVDENNEELEEEHEGFEQLPEEPQEDLDLVETEGYIVQEGDTLHSIAMDHNLTVEDLRYWNNLLDPEELAAGTELSIEGPNLEQAQKEDWQIEFEFALFEQYRVTVDEYESLDGSYYAVYVNEIDTGTRPYATVNAATGEYTVNE
jgi:LysM repeat protein